MWEIHSLSSMIRILHLKNTYFSRIGELNLEFLIFIFFSKIGSRGNLLT